MRSLNDLKQELINCLAEMDLGKMCSIDLLNVAHILRELSEMERVDYTNRLFEKMSDDAANGFGGCIARKGETGNG